MRRPGAWLLAAAASLLAACAAPAAERYDLIIRGGTVYDGTGAPGARADVGIRGDRIASIGNLVEARAAGEIDARGMAVAPGFINMLSQATVTFLEDGRSESDIRQGVTLEMLGEGNYADVAVFDPATVGDRSTFESPHRYALGVRDVLVNGIPC